jgi:RimJ/RimL family protein N-acetyltransferase
MRITLRDYIDAHIPILYQFQLDEEATEMAAFPARSWEQFSAHAERIRRDPAVIARTVLADGDVVGSIGSYEQDGRRFVGYWIGREYWGRGIATEALRQLLALDPTRPIYAYVATHNTGSIRVLEKCGFVVTHDDASSGIDDGVEEVLLVLNSCQTE